MMVYVWKENSNFFGGILFIDSEMSQTFSCGQLNFSNFYKLQNLCIRHDWKMILISIKKRKKKKGFLILNNIFCSPNRTRTIAIRTCVTYRFFSASQVDPLLLHHKHSCLGRQYLSCFRFFSLFWWCLQLFERMWLFWTSLVFVLCCVVFLCGKKQLASIAWADCVNPCWYGNLR